MNCLIWSSSSTSLLGSNLCKGFSVDLGKGCGAPGMERASIVSHGRFAAMLPPKLKFGKGDGIEVTWGFLLGGLRGTKQLACVSRMSNSLGLPFEKSNRLRNLGSSDVSEWAIVLICCHIFEMVLMMISLILDMRVSSSP